MLGRLTPGCEGTRAVFPRCNLGCRPCYHSEDANRVRVDGLHTVTEIARQMAQLQSSRGPTAHCQLIGGEVSLLPPDDHALALEIMRHFGRVPMSFTHGDFDEDYLRRLTLHPDGRPRFDRIDFAAHFDMGMRGRRGIPTGATHESQLTPFRQRFVDMFVKLRKETGMQFYLAHNMTVQRDNLPSLSAAVREMLPMGFRLLSFQPAALQGASKRRVDNLRDDGDDGGDSVWKEIELGVGIRLPYGLFQMGDPRCNRVSHCAVVGVRSGRRQDIVPKVFPLFDDHCPQDVRARDLVMQHFGNIALPPQLLFVKLVRVLLTRPFLLPAALRWIARVVGRAGGVRKILLYGIQTLTIVMHRFMDADDVSVAWQFMESGVSSDDDQVQQSGPRIQETMERLAACSYAMARPEEQRVVPACVQHSVYDPVENKLLASELPLNEPSRSASEANIEVLKSGPE